MTMSARALLALVLGARVLACEPMPDLTFVEEDAGTEDGAPSALLYDATSTEGSAQTTPDANGDAPSSTADSAPICPPSGAPVGTQCCPGGTPCIGPACSLCNQCNCAVGEFCCAKENGGGHVQGTTCSSAATAAQCPTQ